MANDDKATRLVGIKMVTEQFELDPMIGFKPETKLLLLVHELLDDKEEMFQLALQISAGENTSLVITCDEVFRWHEMVRIHNNPEVIAKFIANLTEMNGLNEPEFATINSAYFEAVLPEFVKGANLSIDYNNNSGEVEFAIERHTPT